MNVLNYKSVCERVCIWVHIWASFCLWAVSENGRGLFLSGLIRGSCLFSSLIALPRANIPFVFPLFPLLFIFLLLLLDRKKVQHWSLSLVLRLFFYIFSHISRFPNGWLLTDCWQVALWTYTHTQTLFTSNLLSVLAVFFQVFRYLLMVVLMGPMTRHKTKNKNELIWHITEIKTTWFWQQWHFSWFASKPGELVTFPIDVKGHPLAVSETSLFTWFAVRFCFTSWRGSGLSRHFLNSLVNTQTGRWWALTAFHRKRK